MAARPGAIGGGLSATSARAWLVDLAIEVVGCPPA